MKMVELIEALAHEIETVHESLGEHLNVFSTQSPEDIEFLDALEMYSAQVQRIGEAAELAGFSGLQTVANHVLENTLLLASEEDRTPIVDFLSLWPDLVVHYLRNTDDPSTAAGLVDLLRIAPYPLDEETALKVMHKLSTLPTQADESNNDTPQRPVLARPEDVSLNVPQDVDQQLMNGFLQEAPEQVGQLLALVQKMIAEQGDDADLSAAKRAVHTLKGTGALIGLNGLAFLGHHFEDILEYFEKQAGHVPVAIANLLLDGVYCLEQMVAFVAGGDDFPNNALMVTQNVLDLANRIDKGEDVSEVIYRAGTQPAGGSAEHIPEQATTANTAVAKTATNALRIGLDKIEELFRVSAEVSVHTSAMEANVNVLKDQAKALMAQNLRVKKRLYELETLVDVRSLNMMRASTGTNDQTRFDPLELDQYNELHSTTHALVEEVNDAIAFSHQLETNISGTGALQSQQQNLARDLQHLVMNTRMAEVGSLESRLQRNIRTTCQTTGKQASLTLEGGQTLIDSDVLSKLAEPLLHILRNAVDHGIETPQERQEQGKPESGAIKLSFSRQGQQVVLRCEDDGKGLDLDAIRQRAIERKLITPEQVLEDEDIARLIFMSGFSTRDTVTEVSGRGVGLDVVREWAESMNGSVDIRGSVGQGTAIEMRFSASLSTVQSLIVSVDEHYFALPSIQIEQALSHDAGQFSLDVTGSLRYTLEERILPARYLSQLIGLPSESEDMSLLQAVVIRVRDDVYALAVDKLIDSRELLLKQPDRYTGRIQGVMGTSILGDGSVVTHLDIPQLLGGKGAQTHSHASSADGHATSLHVMSKKQILIVDDSLSVRNTLKELIEDSGYEAITARDGVEAVACLDQARPSAVLTDLEMPNMNGVELTQHIRAREDMAGLPIIMITSRSQEKHREMSMQAGVDVYFTKPYNEGDLLKSIRTVISHPV